MKPCFTAFSRIKTTISLDPITLAIVIIGIAVSSLSALGAQTSVLSAPYSQAFSSAYTAL